MKITTVGLDLAKSVFQVHGVDGRGKAVLRKQLKRSEMVPFFANLPSCLIGMEACSSAHHWARKLITLGHEVRLMAPQFVKPYVKTNKNDRNDAEAICEAVARPNMRFVPVKTPEQQTVLALHRARAAYVKARTAQANQMRGLLGEFGIIRRMPDILVDSDNDLPQSMRVLLSSCSRSLGRSISRSHSSRLRSSGGTCTTRTAGDSSASAALGPLPRARWSLLLAMPKASRTGAKLPHGWDWCRDKILQAARRGYSASASTVMSICARCSSTERAQCFDTSSIEPIEPTIGCGVCWPDATRMSLLSRWPTRMRAWPGRCSRISATSRPITCQLHRADKHRASNIDHSIATANST